jgi:hypothetical protein
MGMGIFQHEKMELNHQPEIAGKLDNLMVTLESNQWQT